MEAKIMSISIHGKTHRVYSAGTVVNYPQDGDITITGTQMYIFQEQRWGKIIFKEGDTAQEEILQAFLGVTKLSAEGKEKFNQFENLLKHGSESNR